MFVEHVLGDGVLREIGWPRTVSVCRARSLVAVAGRVRVESRDTYQGWRLRSQVGVYSLGDLSCRLLLTSRFPVNSLALHPTSPLLAIGSGDYDGGWSFRGELLLVNLETRETVSALDRSVEVRTVSWRPDRDGRTLDIGVSPSSDHELGRDAFVAGFDAMVERSDWTAVGPGSITGQELDGPHRPNSGRDDERSARRALRRLARQAGRRWTYRGAVQDLRMLDDGRFVTAVDGGSLEAWDLDGNLLWSVPGPAAGGRLMPEREGGAVWALGRTADPLRDIHWRSRPLRCVRHSVHDGARLHRRELPPSTYLGRAGGLAGLLSNDRSPLLMDTDAMTNVAKAAETAAGAGTEGSAEEVEGSTPWPLEPERPPFRASDLLPVRGALALYVLLPHQVHNFEAVNGRWVARVEPVASSAPKADASNEDRPARQGAAIHLLFPLPGGDPPMGQLGPLAEIHDARGPALLLSAGSVQLDDPHWTLARRRLPDGTTLWRTDLGARPTALLHVPSLGLLWTALADGDLAALDVRDGSVTHRHQLAVNGLPTVAHTLTAADDGRLLVGTADGRVLVIRMDQPAPGVTLDLAGHRGPASRRCSDDRQ